MISIKGGGGDNSDQGGGSTRFCGDGNVTTGNG